MREPKLNDVVFIGQQDGVIEKDFTFRVSNLFDQAGVDLAGYLCRVHYGDRSQVSVAVCIASSKGEQPSIVNGISKIFHEMFGKHESVDIMFISKSQQAAIAKVCKPFYAFALGENGV